MPLHIFSDRNRAGSYVIMLCLAAAMFATFFFMTQFVQNVLGYSPLKAGVAFLPMTIGIGGTANVISRLVGKIGPRRPMTVGPLLVTGGLLWLSFVGVHAAYISIIGPLMLLAIGMGSTFVPLTLTVMSRVPRGEAGLASALLNTGQQIGGSLGLAVLVTVATSVTRGRLASAGHTVSWRPARAGHHQRLRRRLPDRVAHRLRGVRPGGDRSSGAATASRRRWPTSTPAQKPRPPSPDPRRRNLLRHDDQSMLAGEIGRRGLKTAACRTSSCRPPKPRRHAPATRPRSVSWTNHSGSSEHQSHADRIPLSWTRWFRRAVRRSRPNPSREPGSCCSCRGRNSCSCCPDSCSRC